MLYAWVWREGSWEDVGVFTVYAWVCKGGVMGGCKVSTVNVWLGVPNSLKYA